MTSSLNQVTDQISQWRHQHLRIVLVTGIFDLLHIEHLRFLKAAKKAGDKLVVGIETDRRVRQIKGEHRPIHPQDIRAEQLAALKAVDLVYMLPGQFSSQADWEGLMKQLSPDIYAVSSHSSYLENKREICERYGIQFTIVHPHNPDYSTTNLAAHIAELVKSN